MHIVAASLVIAGGSGEDNMLGGAESSVLAHEAVRMDGRVVELDEAYAGKVVLIVNVASRCGYTRQYEGLEEAYRTWKEDGLVVLGFPANDFGRQEPGSNEQILEFCRSRFDVTFPMFEKVVVTGERAHPVYRAIAELDPPIGGEPRWNFTKFLVDHTGTVLARFEPSDEPMGETMQQAIAEAIEARRQASMLPSPDPEAETGPEGEPDRGAAPEDGSGPPT